MEKTAPRTLDLVNEVPSHSSDELFKDYVNKLCQVCDNKSRDGGDTVTAISVLQYPDRIQ